MFPGKTDSLTAPHGFVLIHVDALLRFYIWVGILFLDGCRLAYREGQLALAERKVMWDMKRVSQQLKGQTPSAFEGLEGAAQKMYDTRRVPAKTQSVGVVVKSSIYCCFLPM